jgi:MFS family permease
LGWLTAYLAILVGYFLNFALFQIAYPFIPLYLIELGESNSGAVAWTGLGQSLGSVALMLANPVWGAMGDRFGRKSMVVRAMAAGAVTLTLMGIATQAWQVFGARILQGVFGGSSVALLTLAALSLPRSRLAVGMGMMQTAQFLGNSFGPLMGTALVGVTGFRGTFFIAAAVMAGVIALTVVAIREVPTPPRKPNAVELSTTQRLMFVMRVPHLRGLLVVTLLFQLAFSTALTLLPLRLAALTTPEDATRAVGVVLTASAIGGASGAVVLGWLASRFRPGLIPALAFAFMGAGLLAQATLTSIAAFAVLRFVGDFFAGGILPALRTLLAEEAEQHDSTSSSMGAVYGVSQSAYSGGQAIGAALAAVVAGLAGIQVTFLVAGGIALVAGVGWRWLVGARTVAYSLEPREGALHD